MVQDCLNREKILLFITFHKLRQSTKQQQQKKSSIKPKMQESGRWVQGWKYSDLHAFELHLIFSHKGPVAKIAAVCAQQC